MRKLRSLRMWRSTRPFGFAHERQIQPMSATTSAATAQRTQSGAEPVVFLALVEDHLQAAGPDDQQAEADVVEGADFGVFDVGRIVDEAGDHEDGENADGDIDVEGVAPTEGVGKPAAEGGAEDRGDDDSQAVGGHGHGPLWRAESSRAGWIATGAARRLRRRPASRGQEG